jgi:hypothetical protein
VSRRGVALCARGHHPRRLGAAIRVAVARLITFVVQPTVAGYITTRAAAKADQLDPFRANNSRAATVLVRAAA